jgi:diguanylate cyclase (GGDEF)-like protein
MKWLISICAVILGFSSCGWAAAPATLMTLHAAAALANSEVIPNQLVAFEATVTYYSTKTHNLNVQENNEAIYVKVVTNANLLPGDRIMVKGTLKPSFLPYVISDEITVLGHDKLPRPLPVTFDDMVGKKINGRFVSVRGVVRTAGLVSSPGVASGRLQLLMDGGYIDIEVESNDVAALKNLVDTEVEVTGAAGRKFDGKMQQVGAKIKATSLDDIKVIGRANTDPWSLPITPLSDIVMGSHVRDLSQRLRVRGIITYYQPGSAVVLQNSTTSLWVSTQTSEPLRIGDVADATGFPDTHGGQLNLVYAEIKDSQIKAPISPLSANWHQLAFWGRSTLGGHGFDLVTITGRVATVTREAVQDEFVLVADGKVFTAIYRHPPPPDPTPPMLDVPLGSSLRVTGICLPQVANPINDEVPFDILLRSFADIQVVAEPSLLNVRNLAIIVFILLFAVMVVGIRSWIIERRTRREASAVAYVEQRRRRILEDINGSRPLAEVIEQITELVTFRLRGSPCWCLIKDGAMLGNSPTSLSSLRVIETEIPAHSGPPLGTMFAAFPMVIKPNAEKHEALSMGAGLASLAIGTRRLYSDLVHRSEFDLLTDIQNRFSMEKQLEALIDDARRTGGIFGIIYIDLDDFKQVNDRYGHQVGDIYLVEAASRMKRQLRPADILARLGGDEFAALVPAVRSRADVEEIASRLDLCFEEPFTAHRHVLRGSASMGIALYPEDANTCDGLLTAADSAMYGRKRNRKSGTQLRTGEANINGQKGQVVENNCHTRAQNRP